jgi:hypothetical protein
MLHVKIILDGRCALGSFRQSLAFLRTAKALSDFLAEVLEHDFASQANDRRERDRVSRPAMPVGP